MKKFLLSITQGKTHNPIVLVVRFFLYALSIIYSFMAACLYFLYKKKILPVFQLEKPVISVGNITVGGVGKTPLVILIAKYFQNKGKLPVILTRGYMDTSGKSDEAIMMKKELPGIPILVGKNRYQNARKFIENNPADVFIMDDGFQHWKLQRDLDIVALDATSPFGNGFIIPRGTLREPKTHLKRANVFVLTKCDQAQNKKEGILRDINAYAKGSEIIETRHKPACVLNCKTGEHVFSQEMNKRNICSFASIGNPDSFLSTLELLKIYPKRHFTFLDHYNYRLRDLDGIVAFCHKNEIGTLITTDKDAVKILDRMNIFENIDVCVLKIEIEILKGKEAFFERISSVL